MIFRFLSISCIILTALCVQKPNWRGIIPFHSNRADVERLIGLPSDVCNCQYRIEKVRLRVDYSSEPCGKTPRGAWNVPRDTVLGLTIYPEKPILVAELGVDLGKLTITNDPELIGYAAYTDNESGIEYNVTDDGRLYSTVYFGTLKDRKTLRCAPK